MTTLAPARAIDQLATVHLDAESAADLRLPPGRLELRRAWPRTPDHLLLEYRGEAGAIAGQWFRPGTEAGGKLPRVARATREAAGTCGGVAVLPEAGVLLQAGGADRRLPGLATALDMPGSELVVHRPERRAVVRVSPSIDERRQEQWAKIVRPDRLGDLLARTDLVVGLPGVATPRLLSSETTTGTSRWSTLPGRCMYRLYDDAAIVEAARLTGAALRRLHDHGPLPDAVHGPQAESRTLSHWVDSVEVFDPQLHKILADLLPAVVRRLRASSGPPVTAHRDFYDKQVFVTDDGQVGLLDFDTLAAGEAALDLANALVHLQWRVLQTRAAEATAQATAAALVAGYDPAPAVVERIPAYADATRLRLCAVYAFRPPWRPRIPHLLESVGSPL